VDNSSNSLNSICSGKRPSVAVCESRNEELVSVTGGEFLNKQRYYQLLEQDSVLWSLPPSPVLRKWTLVVTSSDYNFVCMYICYVMWITYRHIHMCARARLCVHSRA
jgi:hypothetical protein